VFFQIQKIFICWMSYSILARYFQVLAITPLMKRGAETSQCILQGRQQ